MLHVKGSKALYTRSVDNPAALGQGEHLGESRGMHAGVMLFGYLTGALVQFRQYAVDERTLSNS